MNLKLVLKTYSNLRQLTDDESALLETLRAMNDSERELLVESLSPDKVTEQSAPKRRPKRCVQCEQTKRADEHHNSNLADYHEFQPGQEIPPVAKKAAGKKSARAALGEQIQKRPRGNGNNQDEEFPDLLSGHEPCIFEFLSGQRCEAAADANIHHLSSATGYHAFMAAATTPAGKGE